MDLLAIVVLTLLIDLLIYGVPVEPVRATLGLLFVLFFPGYLLVSILYPRLGQLSGVERIALSVALSVALIPLLGLALHFTPWGIRPAPIVLTLSLWILAGVPLAWLRRRRIAREKRFEIRLDTLAAWIQKRRRPVDLALGFALTLVALVIIGAVVWKVQQPVPGEPFTEFYVLGAQNMLQDYPTNLRVGEAEGYNVGIVNREKERVTYVIRAFLGGIEVGSLGPLTLDHGATVESKINVTPATVGDQQKLELRLYRSPQNEVYRTLHLFVDVGQ